MILYICVFMAFSFLSKVSTWDEPKENCTDNGKVYLLEGQAVEWYNSIQGHAWVTGCINQSSVEVELDPSLIEEFAYGELSLLNTFWPAVPEAAATTSVYMKGVTPIGVWGGCSQLHKMEINTPVNLTLISPDWLANCTQLQELIVYNLSIEQIRAIMDSITTVRWISVYSVADIENILWDPIFPSARDGHLWITGLQLTVFTSGDSSEAYNISWAEVSESFVYQLSLLPRLEKIRIEGFSQLDWCASVNYSPVTFASLKELWMPGTATSSVCFRKLRVAPNLTLLAISLNELQFSELLSTCAPQLQVEFVDTVLLYRDDYLTLSDCGEHQKSNITFETNKKIQCNCGDTLWLTRALLEGFVSLPLVTCLDGSALEDQSCDWLYCKRVICNTSCVCCDDMNNGLVADCRDASLSSIPKEVVQLTNLTELLIPKNNLSEFPEELPDSLIFIDLYGNDLLRRSNAKDITSLFAVPERIVRLAANPIFCSCDNQLTIKELQLFNKQIEDYHQMECAGKNQKLGDVDVMELCAERDHSANVLLIVTVALIIAVIALILGVTYFYRRQIQIFLFARGWCLWCINEEELDADRRFDVFLSFCYADEKFVVDELLAKLDKDYAVCVHFRDWNPGGMIPAQIWNSVEQSRRTIVVLSRSFIKSLWGLLEFRSAYVSGLTEGRIRVVMVVLDDVLEKEDLQGELRAYIRLNTYVKWGDPWFWDKLRFALPHGSLTYESRQQRNPDANSVDNLGYEPEMVQMAVLNASGNVTDNQNFNANYIVESADSSPISIEIIADNDNGDIPISGVSNSVNAEVEITRDSENYIEND